MIFRPLSVNLSNILSPLDKGSLKVFRPREFCGYSIFRTLRCQATECVASIARRGGGKIPVLLYLSSNSRPFVDTLTTARLQWRHMKHIGILIKPGFVDITSLL